MESSTYFNIKRPEVVHETIEGETVIVNLDSGNYYSLQSSGADIWNLIETGATYEEMISVMSERYDGVPDDVPQVLRELLIMLQKEGLVQVSSEKQTVSLEPQTLLEVSGEKLEYEYPVLQKFTDMQELLLLDPIHEVDEEGWPHQAEDDGSAGGGN